MATRRAARSNHTNTQTNGTAAGSRHDTTTAAMKEVSPLEIANDDVAPPHDSSSSQDNNDTNNAASIEEQYHSEREQSKLRHWKESEYAAGLVDPTWTDELENYQRKGCCCCPGREALGQMFQEEIDPGCGCVYLSAVVCSRLGAGRIGNMAVLKERYVMVEVDDDDDEDIEGQEQLDAFVDDDGALQQRRKSDGGSDNNKNGTKGKKKKMVRKREIQFVLGPFWPMLLFITFPLIFGVSALTIHTGLPGKPLYVQVIWALLTGQLIRSLFNTGFRDPGILRRHKDPPPTNSSSEEEDTPRRGMLRWRNDEGPWRWTDQAQSYRPKSSMYCVDCKVVVEEFDHTCPWTGTAIGKKNMGPFQWFVGLVFVCLIMDIFLLTTAGM